MMGLTLMTTGITLGIAIVAVCSNIANANPPRDLLFDDDWKFYRGDSPKLPMKSCESNAFPIDIGRCMGLSEVHGVNTADGCRDACCNSNNNCTTWQYKPSGDLALTCWIGNYQHLSCTSDKQGWVTGARSRAPPQPMVLPAFAKTSFDDSTWRTLDLPHDWAIEDLPDRDKDVSVPAIDIRNGSWKFKEGDNASWSSPTFDATAWGSVTVPHDWRYPPTSYETVNATGWYRRNFSLTSETIQLFKDAATNPAVALGPVACSDTTYLNGVSIGSTSGCINYRSYQVDPTILVVGQNSIAVRVQSPGGKASETLPDASPGGICDSAAASKNGVSIATAADWSPPSPFDAARSLSSGANGRSVGYSTAGHGWYRKEFNVQLDSDYHYFIRFDGSYMNTDLWCNNQHIMTHPYGYTTWEVDLTPCLKDGANVLAVRLQTLGANSRWYSGSGLFRHVWFTTTPNVRIAKWGVTVQTPTIAPSKSSATARIGVTLTNLNAKMAPASTVKILITDPSNNVALEDTLSMPEVPANSSIQSWTQSLTIKATSPQGTVYVWGTESPDLYTATVTLSENDDKFVTTFGVRTIDYSSEKGFLLNGEPTTIKGGCVHHDNGILGSAAIDRAEERRVETLKKNGYNAIRTSHNPVSPAFLDACDRLGMLVMDEAFDCWTRGKNPDDYHVVFSEWWERDLTSMVMRDINHPSVVLWSIGNEIPVRDSPEGQQLVKNLSSLVHSLDATRPVTSAVPMVGDKDQPFLQVLDVGGYNYSPNRYEVDHAAYPSRIMVGTESFPQSSFQMWSHYTNNSWVIGDFIWTAIDYIGESSIGNAATSPDIQYYEGQPWEWHISFCGDIDIVGMQKPQAFYRRVLWDNSQIEMLVHKPMATGTQEKISGWGWPDERDSWNWPAGSNATVRVFSKCSESSIPAPTESGQVELLLNGKPVPGSPAMIGYSTSFMATFSVPYEPGVLQARCTNLKNAESATLSTTGAPAALKATADRSTICTSRSDLAYVTVEVSDSKGNRVPDARELLTFDVQGGELAAVGTGDPTDVSSFHQGKRFSYQGRVVAILRPGPIGQIKPGKITLSVNASGLTSTSLDIEVVDCPNKLF